MEYRLVPSPYEQWKPFFMDVHYLRDILAMQVIHHGLISKIITICQQLLHFLVKSLQIERTWHVLKSIYQNTGNVVLNIREEDT